MAFAVTQRSSVNSATTSAGNRATASFTPAANSRLFVFAAAQRDNHAGYPLTAVQTSFALTGQDAALILAAKLTAEQASYSLTGENAGLLTGYVLAAGQTSFALGGQDATLTYTPVGAYTMTAVSAAYALTGEDAGITAEDAGLVTARGITAVSSSFALTGEDAGLTVARHLTSAHGSYTLTGQAAAFGYEATIEAVIASYGTVCSPAPVGTVNGAGVASAYDYLLTETGDILETEDDTDLELESSFSGVVGTVYSPTAVGSVITQETR